MHRVLRLQPGRQPPAGACGASSSGRPAPSALVAHSTVSCRRNSAFPGSSSRRANILEPCRITSTSKELFQSEQAKEMNMDDNGEDAYMDLPDYQVFDPDKGPLEKRVQRSFLDAVTDDKVDLRDTEYWFSNPEGNWNSKPKRVYFMSEDEEPMTPQPWHPPELEEDADKRIKFEDLEEGRVVVGSITDVWLYHGIQIDIGAEFDGLIPCSEELWELAVDHIDVGELVMVEIHKLRTPGLYRWPVQLKFTVRAMQDLMLPPDDYDAPVDHGWAEAMGWSEEDVAAAVGRTLDTPTYFVPFDENQMAADIVDGYGTGDMYWREERSEPVEDYIDDPLENPTINAWLNDRAEEVDAAAESLVGGGGL
ncbi:hypothetical protein PLESTB_001602600 [Pleodorina starrii]|uniref:S1 motif domain-containing protein n=1 Tax=Pleodorina starrii TaxID=330485 RepID=A0A9W6BY18_9CHLO|nr:hypothetical protein PLESTM_000177500 [Pleodorina starrii]GLC60349.1 hypothetical protein PLESTB_001602600 [Pleodorina starrii]GLC69408.1 hypothetical protein PLESTF_000826700 [Pleodorina starrii]